MALKWIKFKIQSSSVQPTYTTKLSNLLYRDVKSIQKRALKTRTMRMKLKVTSRFETYLEKKIFAYALNIMLSVEREHMYANTESHVCSMTKI